MRKRVVALLLLVFMVMAVTTQAFAKLDKIIIRSDRLVFEQEKTVAKTRKSGGNVQISFNLENMSTSRTVDSFDILIYCEDAGGNIIDPTDLPDGVYCHQFTIEKTIKPGKTAYSGYCTIAGTKGIKYIYAAIKRYHFKSNAKNYPTFDFSWTEDSAKNNEGESTVEVSEENLHWQCWTYK